MSLDILQDRIRKMKNPIIADMLVTDDLLPMNFDRNLAGKAAYIKELMAALKGNVAAVRFDLGIFALQSVEGMQALQKLLDFAREQDLYVLLNGPQISTPVIAEAVASAAFLYCDGLVISPFIGSEGIKPFIPAVKDGKSLFVTVRSANRSAAELQDLLTGTRHVWTATAETVVRLGEGCIGKCGYSGLCAVASATAAESLRQLRMKHNRLFLLVDGMDLPSGNAKNASFAFDKFGHGAAVCVGASVTGAWKETEGEDYIAAALQCIERHKKNVLRYVTIL